MALNEMPTKKWSCDTLAAGEEFLASQLKKCMSDDSLTVADKLAVARMHALIYAAVLPMGYVIFDFSPCAAFELPVTSNPSLGCQGEAAQLGS